MEGWSSESQGSSPGRQSHVCTCLPWQLRDSALGFTHWVTLGSLNTSIAEHPALWTMRTQVGCSAYFFFISGPCILGTFCQGIANWRGKSRVSLSHLEACPLASSRCIDEVVESLELTALTKWDSLNINTGPFNSMPSASLAAKRFPVLKCTVVFSGLILFTFTKYSWLWVQKLQIFF